MTSAEYREALARLGVTVYGAGRLLGVDPRTSRRWAQEPDTSSAIEVPGPVAHFLRLLLVKGISGEDALQALGIPKRKPRGASDRRGSELSQGRRSLTRSRRPVTR